MENNEIFRIYDDIIFFAYNVKGLYTFQMLYAPICSNHTLCSEKTICGGYSVEYLDELYHGG